MSNYQSLSCLAVQGTNLLTYPKSLMHRIGDIAISNYMLKDGRLAVLVLRSILTFCPIMAALPARMTTGRTGSQPNRNAKQLNVFDVRPFSSILPN